MSDFDQENKNREPSGRYAIPFFVVLAVITVISFIIPLRPTRSYSEKRELAKFPEFSLTALASGDYFDDITLWFSDTFPGREQWISVASYSEVFYGYSDVMIEGELQLSETVPVPPVPEKPQERPTAPQEPSDPATEPTETGSTETEPTETEPAETESEETEPTEWGGIDAGDSAEILRSATTIQIGDAVFCAQGFSQYYSDLYTDVVNDFYLAVQDTGAVVISAPAPTAVGILIEEENLAKLGSVSQVDMINYMHGGMYEEIVTVDTASALIPHNSEYIYFRTDHHWTALGAYYSYAAVCDAIGMEPVDIDTLEVWDLGIFKGSLSGMASRPLKLTPDTVYAYWPAGDVVHYQYSADMRPTEIPVLADPSQMGINATYLVFGTDYPLAHFQNNSLPDAPNILVVKDSFGNCFAPFLSQNFHNVYSTDYRKFRSIPLTQFVVDYDIDYVLFMPYVTATQSRDGHQLIRDLCGVR